MTSRMVVRVHPGLRRWVAFVVALVLAVSGLAFAPVAHAAESGLSITKTIVDPKSQYLPGDKVTYRVDLSCSSNTEAECDVTATDILDSHLSIASIDQVKADPDATVTVANNTVTVRQKMRSGDTSYFTLQATVGANNLASPLTIPNTATAVAPRFETVISNKVEITVPGATKDVTVDKVTSATSYLPGETTTYTLRLVRPAGATGVSMDLQPGTKFIDTLPAGATFVSASTPWVASTVDSTSQPGRVIITLTEGLAASRLSGFGANVTVRWNADATGTQVNNVDLEAKWPDNTTTKSHDDVSLDKGAVSTKLEVTKTGPASVAPGGVLRWSIQSKNAGNVTLSNPVLKDQAPAGLTNLALEGTAYSPIDVDGVDSVIEFSADGVTWGNAVTKHTLGQASWTIPFPAGTTWFRVSSPDLKPGRMMNVVLRATVPQDTSLETTINNCATITTGESTAEGCSKTPVDEPKVTIHTMKQATKVNGIADPGLLVPGSEFDWGLTFRLDSSVPVPTVTVEDTLPAGFKYVSSCLVSYVYPGGSNEALWASCDNPSAVALTPTEKVNPDGTTRLQYLDLKVPGQDPLVRPINATAYAIRVKVRVKDGTAASAYTNTMRMSTNEAAYQCSPNATDGTDIDNDGNTTELVCTSPNTVTVADNAAATLTKWDKGTRTSVLQSTGQTSAECPDWNGYTRYPCTAVTDQGSTFDYRLRLVNSGNVLLNHYVAYDILPYAGDTGVSQVLAGTPRGTEWTPVLTGPVTLDSALTTATNAKARIEYNLSSNPCRPELNSGATDGAWQQTCDDTWYTAGQITDWSTVKSFRIIAFEQTQWVPTQEIVLQMPLRAPLSAVPSTTSPLDLSIAWNSAAFRVHNAVSGSRLLPAEPPKVGIIVPFEPVKGVSVGNYVWYDTNKDGLQGNSTDEPPVVGATVQLLDANGALIEQTKTNANGYYSFINLTPDTAYKVRVVPLSGYTFTKQDAGGVLSNSRTDDLTDSDVDRATGLITFNSGPVGDNLAGGPTESSAPKVDNPGLDAGLVPLVKGVSVGDYVWVDTNRDGLQSAGEPPLAGVTVQLKDAGGSVVATTTTSAAGYYSFTGVDPDATYSIVFTAPDGYTFTTANASGVTSNDPKADNGTTPLAGTTGGDSDAVVATDGRTGSVTFTSPASGSNLPSDPEKKTVSDNPGIDAGFVSQINLKLAKKLDTAGPFLPGQEVSFTLTPHNDGPMAALPGWSVTDLLPAGLTLVSMSGSGYTCDTTAAPTAPVCTAAAGLAPGADGSSITVKAELSSTFTGTAHNVAWIAPSPKDVVETNPLLVTGELLPTGVTDTSKTRTDNDAQADVEVALVSIGDYVWWDHNRDGQQTAGEPAVADGFVVKLYDAAGNFLRQTTTLGGYYSFTDLMPGTQYTVQFVKPADASFTTRDATGTGITDANDSDANPDDGKVTFTTPKTGSNLASTAVDPGRADDSTIDAGLVKFNLTLAKALAPADQSPYYPGKTVTYTLTPHNDGPSSALTGWSVTDILPSTLTLVSMSGDGYTFSGNTATAKASLAPNSDGPAITVKATINPGALGTIKNVAYVSPAPGDVTETKPLIVPTLDKNTTNEDTDNDAQAQFTVAPVSIGDFVWYDTNRDGVQTAGEPVVDGLTVNLYLGTKDPGETPSATTTTANGGYYAFTGLVPNTQYTVEFVTRAGETFTRQNAGNDDTVDSDVDSNGLVTVTTPQSGSNSGEPTKADDPTIDAGLLKYNLKLTKSIVSTGPYYRDSEVKYHLVPSNDGPVDALAGWSVTDVLPAGLTFVSASGDGYTCTGQTCVAANPLPAGKSYAPITITAKVNAGFTGTAKNVAYVSPKAGDVAETVPLIVPALTKDTRNTDTDNDAEASLTVASRVSVGDYVWWDVNRDGQQQGGEAPVSGVTVNLYAGNVASGGTPVKQTKTDANGFYSFGDLTPNQTYTIEFVKPTGTAFTSLNSGADTSDSDADATTGRVTITAPASGSNSLTSPDDPTIDAGLVQMNLTLAKTETSKAPYYKGSTDAAGSLVTWTLVPHNDGPVNAQPGWTVTDLMPDGLAVVSMAGPGYTCTLASDATTGTCTAAAALAAKADGPVITVTARVKSSATVGTLTNVAYVAPHKDDIAPETVPLVVPKKNTDVNGNDPTDNDASDPIEIASLVSIGDYMWWDNNRDGLQTAGEPPVGGQTVTLYAADGTTVVKTATTDANGWYAFDNLVPGATYVVGFSKPANTVFTTVNASGVTDNNLTTDATDSDADVVTGKVTVVAPATGTNLTAPQKADNPTIDAGLIKLVSIGDRVWYDLDLDGLQTVGEPSVADVVVNLYDASGKLVASTTTNSEGLYSFTNLLAGAEYTLEFVKPADTVFTAKDALLNLWDSSDSDANVDTGKVTITAPASGSNSATAPDDPTIDAGLIELVSIGDQVWFDTNRDGVRQDTEAPVAGVTVNLYDANNKLVKSTKTDNAGFYSFTDLLGGSTYRVEFVAPDGTSFTTANAGSDDALDSDALPATGSATVTTPFSGVNSATKPDDPTIDAGLVKYNLTLSKALDPAKQIAYPGATITYTLGVHNDGPTDALAGWTVTDLWDPAQFELVSMDGGATYDCSAKPGTCVSSVPLPAGADGAPVKVSLKVRAGVTGELRNVAWITPATTDGPETVPLIVPTLDKDTTNTDTDNDGHAVITVPKVSIGDYVWIDANRNGIQDAGEVPFTHAPVTVNLYEGTSTAGTPIKTTTTDVATGRYVFTDLVPNTQYTLEFVLPDGWRFTEPNTGGDAVDSDAVVLRGGRNGFDIGFTTPQTGTNSAVTPDDPTHDAGLVLAPPPPPRPERPETPWELPTTGGDGVPPLSLVGLALLVAGMGVFVATLRRRRAA